MLLTKVQFLVLVCLSRHPMHPYAIKQEIPEFADHYYFPSSSTVQQAIKKLLSAGLIAECQSNPHYWLKARRSIPYELTPHGKRHLDAEISVYFRICQILRAQDNVNYI